MDSARVRRPLNPETVSAGGLREFRRDGSSRSMQAAAQDALLAGNSFQEAAPVATPNPARDFAGGAAPLNEAQEACISVLQSGAMSRRLPILNIQYGEHTWQKGFDACLECGVQIWRVVSNSHLAGLLCWK